MHSKTTGDATDRTLSVVVAAWNGIALLRQCLISLASQRNPAKTEILVVSNFDAHAVEDILRSLPVAKLIILPADSTVPELWACGVEDAAGDIVALLEDHCSCDTEWSEQIRKAHELSYSVVGGAVENAKTGQSSLDWAVYFYDYGKYMLPEAARVVPTLSASNVSYKREALQQIRDRYRQGFHPTFINEELQKRGYPLYLTPMAIVYHNKNYALRNSVRDCYHHGRLFAAIRLSGASALRRAVRGASSVLLPVVLPARIAMNAVHKKRRLKELLSCFPYLLLLMSVWSYGEFCGYLWREGASARQWR